MPLRGLGAGQGDQSCLKRPIKRDFPRRLLPWFSFKRGIKSIFYNAFLEVLDRSAADPKGFRCIGNRPGRAAFSGVTQQQCSRMYDFPRLRLATFRYGIQLPALLLCKGHAVSRRHGGLHCEVSASMP